MMAVLTLPEELLLIALDSGSGNITTPVSATLSYTLPGAVLAELVHRRRIEVDADERVRVIDSAPTGDSVLDSALSTIATAPSGRTAVEWIRRMSGVKVRRQIFDQLIARGIVRHERRKVLWVFTTHRYPANETSTRQATIDRLQAVTLSRDINVPLDDRTLALLSLVRSSNLARAIVAEDQRERLNQRLAALLVRDRFGGIVNRAAAAESGGADASLIVILAATDTSSADVGGGSGDGGDGSDGGGGGGGDG